jgi:Fe-S oxidoreductase
MEKGDLHMWLQWLNFIAFLLVTGYGLFLIGKVIYSRYTYVRLGKPSDFKKELQERLRLTLVNTFGQKKLFKDKKSGIMHIVMFYGFIILQFGALDLIYKGLASGSHLPIPGYPIFTFVQEMTTALIVLAVGYAAYRRYFEKLPRLKRGWKPSIVLFFIFFLMLSVLFSAAFEAIWLGHEASVYTPISSALAGAMAFMSEGAAAVSFYVAWWAHLLILLSFAIYVPQSKHFHLITAPINIFLKRLEPAGKLRTLNLEDEEAESFGVGKIEDFEQKQLIDLYACVECGRCTNMCPASGTGKTLSPMHLITKLRDHLTEKGAAVTSNSPWAPAFVFAGGGGVTATSGDETAAASQTADPMNASLIGEVITEEEIWACTTCRNCEDQCPVMNEHVDKIVDMRRYLVLTEGRIPAEAQRAMQNIERQGNPWGINRNDRIKWRDSLPEGLTAPTVKEVEEFDYLFFVGSMGSYDNRSTKITHALVKILNEAGVKFAILGNEEKNSGDTARRLGNEMLFQMLAQENIETFQKYNVKKIVTACPHTFNTFKNEYPEFGLEAEVLHHTELIGELIREGLIQPTKEVKERITYHDSCYLGRYNEVYDVPRDILRSIPGVELVEMERNREDGLCCGAGGGMMWMEETQGKRVNIERTEQALAVNPTMISSGCPYCLTMMSDGTKAKEADDRVQTLDIAEIVAAAME